MDTSDSDFAHSGAATSMRRQKATNLARYVWDRGISSAELASLTDEQRRKLARAADVNPPSSSETWTVVTELLDRKDDWARANPDHPAAVRPHSDEKIMWVKPPVTPWTSRS